MSELFIRYDVRYALTLVITVANNAAPAESSSSTCCPVELKILIAALSMRVMLAPAAYASSVIGLTVAVDPPAAVLKSARVEGTALTLNGVGS